MLPVLGEKILRAEIVIQGHTPPAPDGPWQGVCPSHIMSHMSHYIPGAPKMPRRRRCRSRTMPPWRPTCKRIYLFYQDKRQIYIYRERERETKRIYSTGFIYITKTKHIFRQRCLFILSRQKAKTNLYIYIYICREKERKRESKKNNPLKIGSIYNLPISHPP